MAVYLYLNPDDLENVSAWLNNEMGIAQIRPDGPSRWKASSEIDVTSGGRHCLFHIDSGPLPLMGANDAPGKQRDHVEPIVDPFGGWVERRAGGKAGLPYFGPGHQAVFWFQCSTSWDPDRGPRRSTFEWIGNHYAILDGPAPDGAKKWWGRLRRWCAKEGEARKAVGSSTGPTYLTFPGAAAEIDAWVADRTVVPDRART